MQEFLAAKEQIIICNSVVDEAIALHILKQKDRFLQPTHLLIREQFSILKNWMHQEQAVLEWVEPQAGVVCFPRIRKELDIDTKKFYSVLYEHYKTVVGPGHWFEQDDRSMRIGFGYPQKEELMQGLKNVAASIEAATV